MKHLDIAALKNAKVRKDPFDYTIVPGFLKLESLRKVISTYPDIMKGGSYPLDTVDPGPALQSVIDEMDGPEFEKTIEEKFGVKLKGQPKMYSLRGYCRSSDGKIHTDSKDKIITVLLYLNDDWRETGGKLRMLRSGTDLSDYAEEVPPDNGTLLVFKRSDRSWHGHGAFDGVRRSIQMNWMVSEGRKGFHALRHRLSAKLKKLTAP
ncbi:MAG: 2OG-Fe(II) oxygenase [Pseudomonadota bacterium]|nr:2OG-Fe(II) oxygenase [Pseudomonadota bacterium]